MGKLVQVISQTAAALNIEIPDGLVQRAVWILDRARSMGIHLVGGKGSGKSRLLGRVVAWQDFLWGIPQVIPDPVGVTIDNFLDKLIWMPREYQERLWPRVRYVDMSGQQGSVVPWPLYYRLGNESLSQIAGRYIEAVRLTDPFLVTASIEGYNPLKKVGIYAGMVLSALDYQITEAEDLLRLPEAWEGRFRLALEKYPEVRPAVDFFTKEYMEWDWPTRARQTASFKNKISLFTLDPVMRAMFGAGTPGIDFRQVEAGRQTVLLDFRNEHNLERRLFKMLWVFLSFVEYVKHRGPGRDIPLGLIIDEVSALTNFELMGQSVFAADLDELINVISRNYMVWPTIAHQEMWQVNERIQKTLMTMGTQILGVTSDPDAAANLARQFYRYDPYLVKKYERVWMSDKLGPFVVDQRSVEFTPEEQLLLRSHRFLDQGRFQFLVRPAPGEGDVTGQIRRVSIDGLDRGVYPNEKLVAQARMLLAENAGRPSGEILEEIEGRLKSKKTMTQLPAPLSEKLDDYDPDDFWSN